MPGAMRHCCAAHSLCHSRALQGDCVMDFRHACPRCYAVVQEHRYACACNVQHVASNRKDNLYCARCVRRSMQQAIGRTGNGRERQAGLWLAMWGAVLQRCKISRYQYVAVAPYRRWPCLPAPKHDYSNACPDGWRLEARVTDCPCNAPKRVCNAPRLVHVWPRAITKAGWRPAHYPARLQWFLRAM